jgi:hypothetical protein
MTKQNSLEDKETYLREVALLAKKKTTIYLTVQKKKHRSKSVKNGGSGLANRIAQFQQKISELLDSTTNDSKWHLTST